MAPPRVFEFTSYATSLPMEYAVDIPAYRAVVAHATPGKCDLPSGANAVAIGWTQSVAGKAGETRPILVSNGVVLVTAAAAIAPGDQLVVADAQGRMQKATDPEGVRAFRNLAVAGNAATLGTNVKALAIVAAKARAGGVTTALTVVPQGITPPAGSIALNAQGTGIATANADAITAVDIDVLLQVFQNICGVALGTAGSAGSIVPMLIRSASQSV